jgi:putative ABC transport system permease protein
MHALRSLSKSPAFSLVSIGILALGIGASTAIFSVVNALLLSPLPYQDARRIAYIRSVHPEQGQDGISPATFVDLAASARSFELWAAQSYAYVNLTKSGPPAMVTEAQATPDYFKLFGVAPLLGRTWNPEDTKTGAAPVVVLGQRLWERQYGGKPELIGQTITIDDVAHTVIGIMPASFKEPWANAELWRPLPLDGAAAKERNARTFSTYARLKPGVTLQQAGVELATLAQGLQQAFPDVYRNRSLNALDLQSAIVGDYGKGLLIVLGAVGCVMLITCANVAGLSVVRAIGRRKELAVRVALGASRARLIRDLLSESLLLAVAGGSLGVLLGNWMLDGLLASITSGWLPRAEEVKLNLPVLFAALGLSVLTGVIFGLAPALSSSRIDAGEALKDQSRGSTGPAARRLRSGLVVLEIALALMLLVSAGLLGRNFVDLLQKKSGLDAARVLSLTLMPSDKRYNSPEKRRDFYARTLTEVSAVPGVEAAGFTQTSPFRWGISAGLVPVPRDGTGIAGNLPTSYYDSVSPDYFRAMGIRLLAGRLFNDSDDAKAKPVAVISETAARRLFGAESPLGRELTSTTNAATRFEIVGLVADVRREGLASAIPLQVYRPMAQRPVAFATLMVRTTLAPSSLAKSVQAALWRVDAEIPTTDVAPMDQIVGRTVTEPRLYLSLFGTFATLALLLAGIGLYGLVAYGVVQRTREFGIRTALGATPRAVLALVLRESAGIIALGLALGLAGAFAAVHLLKQMLFETSVHDPVVFVTVPLALAAIALLACLLPARRATQVDPMTALRAE